MTSLTYPFVAGVVGSPGPLVNLDASTNPNYPAASQGDRYRVTVDGKVGGASGKVVEAGDVVECIADNAGGTEASVGTNWIVLQANIAGMTAAGLSMITAVNAAAQQVLLGITGGGAIALGGFTLTVPATGTAALLGTANAFTAANTITLTALGATPTAGHSLINSTAAAAGAQQYSPSTVWQGNGWKTNATSASQSVAFRAYVKPIQGSAAPTGAWVLGSSINGGAYNDVFSVDSATGNTVIGNTGYSAMLRSTNAELIICNADLPSRGYVFLGNNGIDSGVSVSSDSIIGFTGTAGSAGGGTLNGADARCYREAAAHWTHRNGTTAQILSVANTWTSTTNFERFKVDWSTTANVCRVGTSKGGGGGSNRALYLDMGDTTVAKFNTDGTIDLSNLSLTTETVIQAKTFPLTVGGTVIKVLCA